jgi:hypothetical protein
MHRDDAQPLSRFVCKVAATADAATQVVHETKNDLNSTRNIVPGAVHIERTKTANASSEASAAYPSGQFTRS